MLRCMGMDEEKLLHMCRQGSNTYHFGFGLFFYVNHCISW